MHRHLGPLTGVTGGWAEEWKGTQEWCWRRGRPSAVCENEHNGRHDGAPGRGHVRVAHFSLLDHRTFARRSVAREGRWYYVEGERQLISAAGSPPTLLPCQAGHLSVTGGAQVLRGLASGTGCPPTPARWYSSRAAGVFSGLRCSAPRLRVDWSLPSQRHAGLIMPGVPVVAGVSEVRGPFSVPGTDGVCGSLAAGQPSFTDSRGSRPAGAAVRRRVRGVWTLHPRAVCRSLPAPARAIPGRVYLRADRFLGGYSGGNWMVICVLPVRRGCRCGRALRVPLPE
ncbi:hypothetical protein AAWM_11222 [Aspergillus awamori]|uniref:Uncharacterized protein n=1 Tax=Aspergillus awamori TaxID=105351 RepID=A0A401L9S9_ASPAW|nr:hypothetical protein AAWM_11222 [Aspergillus awamori]